jgi:hypothetical protein
MPWNDGILEWWNNGIRRMRPFFNKLGQSEIKIKIIFAVIPNIPFFNHPTIPLGLNDTPAGGSQRLFSSLQYL